MTKSCWKDDPSDRSTVDHVLATLSSAAEQWKPKHGSLATLSPRDDWSPTFTEEFDSYTISEHENEPPTTTASVSPDRFQPPVNNPLAITTRHPEPLVTVTDVLMDYPHTPHHSNNNPKTTRSATPTTAGVQPQRAPSIGPTPDEMLDRILVRAKSLSGEDDVQKVVKTLERVSRRYLLSMCWFIQADDRCCGPNSK